MARYMYQVHVADGFVDDCEKLMARCTEHQPLTFHTFTELWKGMNFGGIYKERRMGAEVAELSEEAIHIAKRYLIADTSNFEDSVAGLFLVYGLASLQPFKGFAALRLVPEDVPSIRRIEFNARRERRLDVLYILGSLLERHARCHALQREYGFEHALRKYLQGCTGIDASGVRPRGVFFRQNQELDLIRDYASVAARYHQAKGGITNERGRKDPNLNYVDEELSAKLERSLKGVLDGFIDKGDGPDADEKSPACDRSDRIRDIKARAMRGGVQPAPHLVTRQHREIGVIPGRRTADIVGSIDTVSLPGKVKSGSPTKPLTTGGSRKRKPNKRKVNAKKKKKYIHISSDSDSSVGVPDLDTDDGDNDDDDGIESDDLNEDSDDDADRNYERVEIEIEDINNLNKVPDIDALVEKEFDVHIDTVPIIITGSTSKDFQIEFVDNFNKGDVNKQSGAVIPILNELPGEPVSTTGHGSSADAGDENCEGQLTPQDEMEAVTLRDISEKLKKRERRELKQPILKSKFKKMGLEKLANFKESKKKRKLRR